MAVAVKPDLVTAMRTLRDGRSASLVARLFSPLSDVAAALGLSQLSRYHEGLHRRRVMAARYTEALVPWLGDSVPALGRDDTMYFRFPLRLSGGLEGCADAFAQSGVAVRRGVNTLLHRLRGLPDTAFKMSCTLFATTVLLPVHPSLTDAEQDRCIAAAVAVLSATGGRAS